ncbi:unnamed protein product, partial [marine sediment metagenome]
MHASRRRLAIVIVVAGIAALLIFGLLRWRSPRVFSCNPASVMGTDCELTVVMPGGQAAAAKRALRAAEAALRDVEVHMSKYLAASGLARFNAAAAGEVVALSPHTLEVLRLSKALAAETAGAFDVTCLPLIDGWVNAGKAGRLPTAEELAQAKHLTGWRHVELLAGGARKRIDGAG